MQFSGKIATRFWGWRPHPIWKILNPPLHVLKALSSLLQTSEILEPGTMSSVSNEHERSLEA